MVSEISSMSPILAVPAFLAEHVNWILGGLVVLAGVVVGLSDLVRFSVVRSWAISAVSFDESLRRRVLLITPVAILGVIVVSQLQNPVDAADAVRQTIKVALFATGMVVVITTIIMACTNLPKEIDNRVIYTVVTKPTTRLEIVIGKVLGFAKVSALLLLIMGLFTWGYVQFRAWNYEREIRTLLSEGRVDESSKPTLSHYASAGLLGSKKYEWGDTVSTVARVPAGKDDPERWFYGSGEQDVLIPFEVQPGELIGPGMEQVSMEQGAVLVANIDYVQTALTPEEAKHAGEEGADIEGIETTTKSLLLNPASEPTTKSTQRPPPKLTVNFLDRNRNSLVTSQSVNGGKPITFGPKGQPIEARITGEALTRLSQAGRFYVQLIGASAGTQYGIKVKPVGPGELPPVAILIPGARPDQHTMVAPVPDEEPIFRGRLGVDGQQLRGGEAGKAPATVYAFREAEVNPTADGAVPFEFTGSIEKSGDEPSDADVPTKVEVSVVDAATGKTSGTPVVITPESNRTYFFTIPAASMPSGVADFDIVMRNLTPGHWVTVRQDGLAMVVTNQPFAYNLLKGLLVMWLLSVLVVVVAIFCSTFLSWPIAIVLTLVLLLGRWGVDQLGDAAGSGIGNQVATDLGFRNPAEAKVVSTSVEALNKLLNTVSGFLPDIGAFGGTESVERGVSIPTEDVWHALVVLVAFGVPLTMGAYLILRNKEVAP